MIARFEELDWQPTRMGDLTLRRRTEPTTGDLIYEVKLGDEYLMSSLFTVAEEELATLGLAVASQSWVSSSIERSSRPALKKRVSFFNRS